MTSLRLALDIEGRALFLGGKRSAFHDPMADSWEDFPHVAIGKAFWLDGTLFAKEGYTLQAGDTFPRERILRYEPS